MIFSLLDWSPPRRYQKSTSTELRAISSAVHFVAIDGQHAHEVDSPSFYNLFEIEAVVDICLSLLSTKGVRPEEIGIIAAFRSQVLKLRTALRSAGLSNVNVGSVLDLQGQEVKVVIVSTVLTSRLQCDRGEAMGLLGDHRKFNVAVTRGMALCIGKLVMIFIVTNVLNFKTLTYYFPVYYP
jgi:superfamily I DNA and/or RNA helicase